MIPSINTLTTAFNLGPWHGVSPNPVMDVMKTKVGRHGMLSLSNPTLFVTNSLSARTRQPSPSFIYTLGGTAREETGMGPDQPYPYLITPFTRVLGVLPNLLIKETPSYIGMDKARFTPFHRWTSRNKAWVLRYGRKPNDTGKKRVS